MLNAAFEAGHAWAAFLIVASSFVAVIYVGRIVELMLLRPVPTEGPYAGEIKEAPLSMIVPLWILVAANIYFGLRIEFTGGLASKAAEVLTFGSGGAL